MRFVGRVAVLHMDGIDMVAEPSCGIRTIILLIEPSQSGERIRQVPNTPVRLRYDAGELEDECCSTCQSGDGLRNVAPSLLAYALATAFDQPKERDILPQLVDLSIGTRRKSSFQQSVVCPRTDRKLIDRKHCTSEKRPTSVSIFVAGYIKLNWCCIGALLWSNLQAPTVPGTWL